MNDEEFNKLPEHTKKYLRTLDLIVLAVFGYLLFGFLLLIGTVMITHYHPEWFTP